MIPSIARLTAAETWQITLEAAITGTIAAVAGTALAIIAVTTVARARDWTTTLNPTITLIAP